MSEYDCHRRTLLLSQTIEDDWQAELCRYLKAVPADVNADTDIVEWWSDNAKIYPTFARMALDQNSQLRIVMHVLGLKLLSSFKS
ncbi:hypothetical protein DXG01_014477 [Tephrocybe rancida]|nr:hypothetical protein DXG01_014477 [Tephrocybe rancida]